MADAQDDDFGKELAAAFEADEAGSTPKPPETPAEEPKPGEATPPAPETPPKPGEEPKKDEPAKPEAPKEGEPATPPAADEKKPEEDATKPKDPEAPKPPEEPVAPQPLTKEDVTGIIQNIQTQERTSTKQVEETTKEVLDAYYPEGLSNTLVDQATGKELKTPADVVAVTNGAMTTEEAAQWLMNEQFKLDQSVAKIKEDAKNVAETTINFKRDCITALQKYEPLFKWQPTLQPKVFDKLMKMVKADEKRGVILSSPDVMDHYDFYLEPYRLAFEYATKNPATNPTPEAPAPEPPKPGADDRLDEGGDGGASTVDDPNDFAQQVTKELAREM